MERTIRRYASALVLAGTLAGCKQNVNLDAVRQLAKATADAAPAYDLLARDYVDSCERTKTWEILDSTSLAAAEPARSETDPRQAPQKQPKARHVAEGRPTPTPQGSTSALNALAHEGVHQGQRKVLDAAPKSTGMPCSESILPSERWRYYNRLLIAYVRALGDLAGNGVNDYDVSKATGSLTTAGILKTDAESTAMASAATAAIRGVFEARRRNAIADAVIEGNNFVEFVTEGLTHVAKVDYAGGSLFKESLALDAFYGDSIAIASPLQNPPATLSYQTNWTQERSQLSARRDGALIYVASLTAIKNAHHGILNAVLDQSPAGLEQVYQMYVTDFTPDIEALKKAFK